MWLRIPILAWVVQRPYARMVLSFATACLLSFLCRSVISSLAINDYPHPRAVFDMSTPHETGCAVVLGSWNWEPTSNGSICAHVACISAEGAEIAWNKTATDVLLAGNLSPLVYIASIFGPGFNAMRIFFGSTVLVALISKWRSFVTALDAFRAAISWLLFFGDQGASFTQSIQHFNRVVLKKHRRPFVTAVLIFARFVFPVFWPKDLESIVAMRQAYRDFFLAPSFLWRLMKAALSYVGGTTGITALAFYVIIEGVLRYQFVLNRFYKLVMNDDGETFTVVVIDEKAGSKTPTISATSSEESGRTVKATTAVLQHPRPQKQHPMNLRPISPISFASAKASDLARQALRNAATGN